METALSFLFLFLKEVKVEFGFLDRMLFLSLSRSHCSVPQFSHSNERVEAGSRVDYPPLRPEREQRVPAVVHEVVFEFFSTSRSKGKKKRIRF